MTTPPPDRPPTILSEHGEGYCRVCRFIEPLTELGVIAEHYRGQVPVGSVGDRKPCKGSHMKPPRLTPYFSRLAEFRTVSRSEAATPGRDHSNERG